MSRLSPRNDLTVKHQEMSELNAASFKRGKYRDGLSFLFIGNVMRTYPDTGESGDAYDAEAFLDG
jgi:hypothetical protein